MTCSVILPADAPREQWLKTRQSGIGGSDASTAIGLNPYESRYALWLEKTGRAEPRDLDSLQIEVGKALEPMLINKFDRRSEWFLTGGAGTYASDAHPWMRANVDALAWGERKLQGVVEVKTGSHRQLQFWVDDQVPLHYVVQSQWYAHVLGAPRVFVVALLDNSTYVERTIERDDSLINDIVGLASEFWRMVSTDTPPPIDGSKRTKEALARIKSVEGKRLDLGKEWREVFDEREELSRRLAEAKAARDELDNRVRAALLDAEVAYIDDEQVATFRAPKVPQKSADWGALKSAYPEVYAEVVTEAPATRRLTYKKRKRRNEGEEA